MGGERTELIRRIVERTHAGDFSEVLAAFDPRVEYTPVKEWPESTTRYGVDALVSFVETLQEEWGRWEGEVRDVQESGDRVLAETRITSVGEYSGIELRGRVFHVYTFQEGKIVKVQDFLARSDAYRAAGLPT